MPEYLAVYFHTVALYKEVGRPVKDYLPPDDEKTRKNTMWRLLFEYFDKVDGKPSKTDVKVRFTP